MWQFYTKLGFSTWWQFYRLFQITKKSMTMWGLSQRAGKKTPVNHVVLTSSNPNRTRSCSRFGDKFSPQDNSSMENGWSPIYIHLPTLVPKSPPTIWALFLKFKVLARIVIFRPYIFQNFTNMICKHIKRHPQAFELENCNPPAFPKRTATCALSSQRSPRANWCKASTQATRPTRT